MNEQRRQPADAAESRWAEFNRQFDQPRRLPIGVGWADYVDLRPADSAGRPLVVVPGWSEGLDGMRDLARVFYDRQRRNLLADFSGLKPADRQREPYHEIVDKSEALIQLLTDAGVGPVDLLAHSEGVLTAAYAARHHPERFNNLVLAMPAGMIGHDSPMALTLRFLPKLLRGITRDMHDNPPMAMAINRGVVRHLRQHPSRALREVKAMAKTTIDQPLHEIRFADQQPAGPRFAGRIGILQAGSDPVFPHHFIESQVRLEGDHPQPNTDAYASIIDKSAGHDDLWLNPQSTGVACLQMLDSLEASRLARQESSEIPRPPSSS